MGKTYVKGCVVAAAIIFLMTGCGDAQVNLTPEQETQVGEYAAMALLRHDANNRSRLVSLEEVEAREQELLEKEQQEQNQNQETEEHSEGMDPVTDIPTVEKGADNEENAVGSMEEFFGLPEGVTIAYGGLEVCDSYPENGDNEYFTLDAAEGKRLLVLRFNLVNQSQSNQTIDILSQNALIKIIVNGSHTCFALTTMLMDDLSTYKGEVAAGECVSLVLLAELDSDKAETVSDVSLSLKNKSQICKVQL